MQLPIRGSLREAIVTHLKEQLRSGDKSLVGKVFLSHSTKDKEFVQCLADDFKAEEIEAWLCEVDVEFGNNFVAEIEKGLSEADLTLLFWSPDAAASDWTRLE